MDSLTNRSSKVALSCAIGAFLGTLFAVSVSMPLWWLGLILGFCVGYIAYEYERIPAAASKAWTKAQQPDVCFYRKEVFSAIILMSWIGAWGAFGYLFLFRYGSLTLSNSKDYALLSSSMLGVGLGMACAIIALFIFLEGSTHDAHWFWWEQLFTGRRRYKCRDTFYVIITCSLLVPAVGFFLAVALTPLVLIQAIFLAVRFFGRFAWHLFKIIHSELRLLCGCDAALGICVGYAAHVLWFWPGLVSALLGAVAGAAFGLANYELISKRWLKLVPA